MCLNGTAEAPPASGEGTWHGWRSSRQAWPDSLARLTVIQLASGMWARPHRAVRNCKLAQVWWCAAHGRRGISCVAATVDHHIQLLQGITAWEEQATLNVDVTCKAAGPWAITQMAFEAHYGRDL